MLPISPRERDVLKVISLNGARSYEEIAAALQPAISPRTAEAHVLSIYRMIEGEPGVHGGPLMAVVVFAMTTYGSDE